METNFKFIMAGVAGGFSFLFGNWSEALSFLCVLVGVDYISGLAASIKEGKGLSSNVGYWGLMKKFGMFMIIGLFYRADILLGIDSSLSLMSGAIFFYIANELISIAENYGRMGWPMPDQFKKMLTVMKEKNEGDK